MAEAAVAPLGRASPGWAGRLRALTASHATRWVALWLGACAALLALDRWLLTARGAAGAELLYWEARRRLVAATDPPRIDLLSTSDQPLVLYLATLAGSALLAAAAVGATCLLALTYGWRRAVRRAVLSAGLASTSWPVWALLTALTALHPAVLVVGAQYPAPALRALLILATTGALLLFARSGATYALMLAALSLGALSLLDLFPWPLWLYLALALLLTGRRRLAEQATLVLMLLFPAAVLSAARALLTSQVVAGEPPGGARRAACTAWEWGAPSGTLDGACLASPGLAGQAGSATALLQFAPATLFLTALAVAFALAGRRAAGVILLLALPLLEALSRPWLAPLAITAPELDVTLPLLAAPLLAGYAWIPPERSGQEGDGRTVTTALMGVTAVLLVVGGVVAWTSLRPGGAVAPGDSEPRALVRAARGAPPAWLTPYRTVAARLDAEVGPGDRVLLDDAPLFPVLALVAGRLPASGALLLPHQPASDLAVQCPSALAGYVLLGAPGGGPVAAQAEAWAERLALYDVLEAEGPLRLLRRRGPPPGAATGAPGAGPCLGAHS